MPDRNCHKHIHIVKHNIVKPIRTEVQCFSRNTVLKDQLNSGIKEKFNIET